MDINFRKYQGAGNDFIIIDNRNGKFDYQNTTLISFLCHRRFGIGADGLMLLENDPEYSFKMRYYNSDGKEASMCGNGGRCISAYAAETGVITYADHFIFNAVDGIHEASYKNGMVELKMQDVNSINIKENAYFLNTGSPHHVTFVKDLAALNVFEEGKAIRYSNEYKAEGTNVNFVNILANNEIHVRTYERGVEDETLACGTGAVASAICTAIQLNEGNDFKIKVEGGDLRVSFDRVNNNHFTNIFLEGPATFVFEGSITI